MQCINLVIDLGKLKKVITLIVGIGGKPVRVKGSVELPIALEDSDRKRTLR